MRAAIRDEIAAIAPLDALERRHLAQTLAWVDSGAPLCRIAKPATPAMHLVSYFVVTDVCCLLLVDHIKAQLWLPPGGHVEEGEHPRMTVMREMEEELGCAPLDAVAAPLFLTCTETGGLTAGHVDVSLWYLVRVAAGQEIRFCREEFVAVRWFAPEETPLARSDPHMARFLEKLGRSACASG